MASSQRTQLQFSIIMRLLVLVVVVVVVLSLSSLAAVAAPTTAYLKKHGCRDSCGNVSIPYPFGVKKNCYLNDDFLITCNQSQSQPYLSDSNIPVTNISLEESGLRIMQYISRDCYDPSGTQIESNRPAFWSTTFTISSTKNKFITMGCDTYGYLQVYRNDTFTYSTGCNSECTSIDDVPNGTCSGIGCCQTFIPKRVAHIDVAAYSFNNHTNVSKFNPCSYAFVVEEGAFNFSTTYLQNFNEEEVPIVLDWAIGEKRCDEAKRNQTSYGCGENTACYEAENVPGYICKCLNGYKGNPYLSDGCQDINECNDPNLNQCVHESKCVNQPGNYRCSCPQGYRGDGRINGKGCINQFLVIQIILGVVVSVALVFMCSSLVYWIFRNRKLIKLKEKFFLQNGGLMLQQQLSKLERSTQEAIKIFTEKELKQATNNNDKSKIVGQGGFGTVYKGTLADNRIVAIKESKFKEVDQSQIKQFINEIVVLSQINHRNVVKLLGCCLETPVPLLVYEFITNGTLSDCIHKAPAISWQMRLRIAIETAGALSYLHSEASIPIIHRDVKTMNILLDDNYTAKVSDFGSSRLVPLDQNQLSTIAQGTPGYFDPESWQTNQLTEKSDVYSFGVVLAELITGKKAWAIERPENDRNLANYFISSMKNGRFYQDIDERMVIEGDTYEQLKKVADIAERCLQVKGDERPTMKEVSMELEGLIMKKMEKHPWVETKSDVNSKEMEDLLGKNSSGYEYEGCSSNTTTTEFYTASKQTIMLLPLKDGR